MSTHLPLSRGLYEKVTKSHTSCLYTRIQFLRGGESIEAIADNPNETLEIGIPKKAYLALFTEGHTFFQGTYPSPRDVPSMSQHQLEDTYFACISLLSTTNEYSTVWRVHEQVVWELARRSGGASGFWVKKDFAYMIALATSSLDKINKSSVLWHWLRKLAVVCVFQGFSNSKFYTFCQQVLRSMNAHFANYAAGFTLVWLVQVARSLNLQFDEKAVISLLRESCRKSLGDISLWTAFGRILAGRNCVYAETSYLDMASRLECEVPFTKDPSLHKVEKDENEQAGKQSNFSEYTKTKDTQRLDLHQSNTNPGLAQFNLGQEEASRELHWLLDVQCVVASPYRHVMQSIADSTISQKMIRQRLESVEISKETDSSRKFRGLLQQLLQK